MSDNLDLSKFAKALNVMPRLDPRDSFFGGRVNAATLHYKIKDGETIEYVDFTSLYPAVNKYDKYMVGHPQIILCNFNPLTIILAWRKFQCYHHRVFFIWFYHINLVVNCYFPCAALAPNLNLQIHARATTQIVPYMVDYVHPNCIKQ